MRKKRLPPSELTQWVIVGIGGGSHLGAWGRVSFLVVRWVGTGQQGQAACRLRKDEFLYGFFNNLQCLSDLGSVDDERWGQANFIAVGGFGEQAILFEQEA